MLKYVSIFSTWFYTRARRLYRTLPLGVRRRVTRSAVLGSLKEAIKRRMAMVADPSHLYDSEFFANRTSESRQFTYSKMADSIVEILRPGSVVDVGCGDGQLLEQLQLKGIQCLRIEVSEHGVKLCKERGVAVIQMDLRTPTANRVPGRFDLGVCLEVAEHLPESCAEGLVRFLCHIADTIAFSAAQPGQGGEGHINEQPPSYWINHFKKVGYQKNDLLTSRLRDAWASAGVLGFYWKNLLIFEKRSLGDKHQR